MDDGIEEGAVEGSRCRQCSTGDFDGKGSGGEDQSIGKGADGAVEVNVMSIGQSLWREGLIGKGKEFDAAELISAVMESAGVGDRETGAGGCDLVISEVAGVVGGVSAITTIDEIITLAAIDGIVAIP